MAGRVAYFVMAGAALIGGMFMQGDLKFGDHRDDFEIAKAVIGGDDREIDRTVARIVDRETESAVVRGEAEAEDIDPAAKAALTQAVAELVRAEGSLITARMDDDMPAEAIKQAEQRRDFARQAVERLSDDVKAESRGNRAALRANIRDSVRTAVRN